MSRTRNAEDCAIVVARSAAQSPDTTEIEGLADAAGYAVVDAVTQRRREDPGTWVGSGKAETLAEQARASDADVVVFDGGLDPGQYANLVDVLPDGVEPIDRYRLVLDVFADGTGDERAALQVELARLEYRLPRLRRTTKLTQMAKANEKGDPVFDLEDRIDRLENRLDALADRATERREHRRADGLGIVAIAGYTNAGKTTLLHRLADEMTLPDDETGTDDVPDADDETDADDVPDADDGTDADDVPDTDDGTDADDVPDAAAPDTGHDDLTDSAPIDDRLFVTLETITRRGSVDGFGVAYTDTVGFVDALPHDLVESFSATIDEASAADVTLLVVDATDEPDRLREKVATAIDAIGDTDGTTIGVLNKIDAVSNVDAQREALAEFVDDVVAVSALEAVGIDALQTRIREALPTETATLTLPNDGDGQRTLSWLHDHGSVESVEYGSDVTVTVCARPTILERARARVA
jgi:GTP-binding protein HflX